MVESLLDMIRPAALATGAWVLSYLLHSSLILGFGLGLCRLLGPRRRELRELALKTAILAPLLTASLPLVLDYETGLSLRLGRAPAATETVEAAPEIDFENAPLATAAPSGSTTAARVPSPPAPTAPPAAPPQAANASTTGERLLLASAVIGFVGALVGLARLLFGALSLRRTLGRRRSVSTGPLPELAARLARRGGRRAALRLSWSENAPSPMALGSDEICLPLRALRDLDAGQQEAMLAHELAHLARRDPLWFRVALVLERLFPFQPLHRSARRRLQEDAEFLADAWALRLTGDALGLASCLSRVAEWTQSRPPLRSSLAAMAGSSVLVERVEQLLNCRLPTPAIRLLDWQRGLGASLVALLGLLAPTVSDAPEPAATDLEPLHEDAELSLEFRTADAEMRAELRPGGGLALVRAQRRLRPSQYRIEADRTVAVPSPGSAPLRLGVPSTGGFCFSPPKSSGRLQLDLRSREGSTRLTLLGGRTADVRTTGGHRLSQWTSGLTVRDENGRVLLQLFETTELPERLSLSAEELGLQLARPTEPLATHFRVSREESLLANVVLKDGPAARAGIRPYDLITHVNGVKVKASLTRFPKLSPLLVRVRRRMQTMDIAISLREIDSQG